MPPSRSTRPRPLSDADSRTFAPSLPAEAFEWRWPGAAVLKFEGFSNPIELPVPSASPKPTASVPPEGSTVVSAPIRDSTVVSVPIKSSTKVSMPPSGGGPPGGSPPGTGSSPADIPSNALPRECVAHVVGMKDDPKSFYRYKRTCGPAIDQPSEEAGPIADRRCVDAPALSINNAYGNLRVHVVSATEVQVWYLGKTCDNKPGWVKASAGDEHPDKEGLPDIVLSMATPFRPQWIKSASYAVQKTPSRLQKVKFEPY